MARTPATWRGLRQNDRKPKQTLSEFYLYRLYDPNPALEEVDPSRDEAIAYFSKPDSGTWTDVIARFSDTALSYTQSVSCWVSDGKRVMCGVDCDGGSFHVDRREGGIAAGFDKDGGGLSLNQSCGDPDDESGDRWMTSADAGGVVELSKQPPAACLAADREARPAFAADPVPLRQRIAETGWRCLKRSYDKAHMAKHPNQKVTALSVAIRTVPRVDKPEGEYPSTLMDVTLSFRMRDGKVKTRDVECRASQYQFYCDGDFRLRRRDGKTAWLVAGGYVDKDNPPAMLDTVLGSDDLLFRLDASTETDCSLK